MLSVIQSAFLSTTMWEVHDHSARAASPTEDQTDTAGCAL